ncbi:hypothetical protein Ae168Ps1_2479 [Pseudonocardia sp. Ae168_Ps1]|nr:hypothetical protein Ae168Ps1_2479 [Pseudonocardia sp. Ae168_Ps1]
MAAQGPARHHGPEVRGRLAEPGRGTVQGVGIPLHVRSHRPSVPSPGRPHRRSAEDVRTGERRRGGAYR